MDFIYSIQQNYYLFSANELAEQAEIIGDYDIGNLVTMYIKYQKYIQKMIPEKISQVVTFRDMNSVFEYYLINFEDNTYEKIIEAGFMIQPKHLTFFVKKIKPSTVFEETIYLNRLFNLIALLSDVEILSLNEKEEILDSLRPNERIIYDVKIVRKTVHLLKLDKINGTYFLRDCFRYIDDQQVLEAYVDFLLTESLIDFKSIKLKPKFPFLMTKIAHQMIESLGDAVFLKNYLLNEMIGRATKKLNRNVLEDNKWKEHIHYLKSLKITPNDLYSL